MSFTIATARSWARQFCRNAQDSSAYTARQIDRALQLAGDEWLRFTKSSRTLGTLTLTAGNYNLPAAPTGWIPEFQMKQTLLYNGNVIDPYITFTDYNEVLQAQFLSTGSANSVGTSSVMMGTPRIFGYRNETDGICFPTPDQNYTLLVWFWQKFTEWTPGNAELQVSVTNFGISSVGVLSGGYYDSVPTATVTGGSGSGATFLVGLNQDGSIREVGITTQGVNYTSPLTISVNGIDCGVLTFDVPDDAMRVISTDGCESYLQANEQQNQNLSLAASQRFKDKARQFKGRDAGGRGGNVTQKSNPDCIQNNGYANGRGYYPYGPWYPVG